MKFVNYSLIFWRTCKLTLWNMQEARWCAHDFRDGARKKYVSIWKLCFKKYRIFKLLIKWYKIHRSVMKVSTCHSNKRKTLIQGLNWQRFVPVKGGRKFKVKDQAWWVTKMRIYHQVKQKKVNLMWLKWRSFKKSGHFKHSLRKARRHRLDLKTTVSVRITSCPSTPNKMKTWRPYWSRWTLNQKCRIWRVVVNGRKWTMYNILQVRAYHRRSSSEKYWMKARKSWKCSDFSKNDFRLILLRRIFP